MPDPTPRLGLTNHGGFFSPYYLFELLARQHGDELDPEGREANRRPLRRLYRKAEERLASGSTAAEAWTAWHRELLEALGFTASVLRRLDAPVETAHHDAVPISHGAFLQSPTSTQSVQSPLLYIDCHGFGVDLDRDHYLSAILRHSSGQVPNRKSEITEEPISRAIEFALDQSETRWAIVLAGSEMRLYRKGGSVARQYLQVNFSALFDADRTDEWTAFWGLFRLAAFAPDDDENGRCLLDRVLEASQRHASRIADDLRENIVLAVEAIIQGILDDPANHPLLGPPPQAGEGAGGGWLSQLFEETLYFLYRLLFILYAESRDLLPVGESVVYRDTYSLEHLRDLAERPLHHAEGERTYFIESIRTLLRMLQEGYPPPGSAVNPGFSIDAFNGQLFDPRRTALIDRCRIPDRAMHAAMAELSLSRPKRRSERRERFSYAELGVDQLGSIYEGLLVYEPALVAEETVLARVKGEERWLTRAQADENDLEIVTTFDGQPIQKQPGQFILRLWGGRRKGSGSYYTPQEITSFLVKEALEPLVTPIIEGCARPASPARGDRRKGKEPGKAEGGRARHADEILDLKVCDPAMGSGAFLIQACRYLAEAYGRARIAEGLDDDARVSSAEFAAYKRLVAERCLYGVDLNPMAVELAKVSLWLETLARGKPLDFLDAHLRCGNSLIGAPLRDAEGNFTIERLLTIPDDALKEVSKEASKEDKAAARERIKRNKEEARRVSVQQSGQLGLGVNWGVFSLQSIETALADYLAQRTTFERPDADMPPAEAVALVHEKEQAFHHLQTDPHSAYLRVRQLCDLWCAAWFWPSGDDRVTGGQGDTVTRGQGDTVKDSVSLSSHLVTMLPPTTQVYLELASALLGTDPGSLSDAEREAYWDTVKAVWREQRFFHWELEFPEVWRDKRGQPKKNGGFDAVVGNPPWETVKPNSQEFWSNYDPLFRELPKQAALRRADEFRAESLIDAAWLDYLRRIEATGNFLKASELYPHQGRGDINTYKLFLECAHRLARTGGGLSQVLPSGIYTDLGSADLRRLFFETTQVRYLLAFANEKFIFPAVHHAFRFVLLNAQRGDRSDALSVLFRLNVRNAIAPDELLGLLAGIDAETLRLRVADVRRFSPDTLSLMEFKNQQEIDITARIYNGHPLLSDQVVSAWNVRFTREFDMTNDSHLFNDREWLKKRGCVEQTDGIWQGKKGERYLPLYEGKMLFFEIRLMEPQWWIEEVEGKQHLRGTKNIKFLDCEDYRFGYRRISASTNERTMVLGWIPKNRFAAYTWTTTTGGNISYEEQLFLYAVMGSFVIDFILRPQVTTSVAIFNSQVLPVPRAVSTNTHFDSLVPCTLRLTCTTPEFADLWKSVTGKKWRAKDGAMDPRERAQLRAEIDALVADLYGLSEADFAYILSTFPLLDRDQPPLPDEAKSYITRDMALLELFKLRGKTPPKDIVAFHREAGVDISAITGPVRQLEKRVQQAQALGAVAYIPSGRGGGNEVEMEDEEMVSAYGQDVSQST